MLFIAQNDFVCVTAKLLILTPLDARPDHLIRGILSSAKNTTASPSASLRISFVFN